MNPHEAYRRGQSDMRDRCAAECIEMAQEAEELAGISGKGERATIPAYQRHNREYAHIASRLTDAASKINALECETIESDAPATVPLTHGSRALIPTKEEIEEMRQVYKRQAMDSTARIILDLLDAIEELQAMTNAHLTFKAGQMSMRERAELEGACYGDPIASRMRGLEIIPMRQARMDALIELVRGEVH